MVFPDSRSPPPPPPPPRCISQYGGAPTRYGEMGGLLSFAHTLLKCGLQFPVIKRVPKYLHKIFSLLSVTSFECHHQNLRNKSCRFKTWMEIVGQILIKWGFSLVSQHNLLEVPSGVINANKTEPLGDHWTMHRSLEKRCSLEVS